MSFEQLPRDVVRRILDFLPEKEWGNVALVNKQLGGKFQTWNADAETILKCDFPDLYRSLKEKNTKNWLIQLHKAEKNAYWNQKLTQSQVDWIRSIKADIHDSKKYDAVVKEAEHSQEKNDKLFDYLVGDLFDWLLKSNASRATLNDVYKFAESYCAKNPKNANQLLGLSIVTRQNAEVIKKIPVPDNYLVGTFITYNATFMKMVLESGATINVNAADEYGLTPLHLAHDKEVVKLLLEKGANLEAKTTGEGLTPLQNACRHNRTAVIKLLLARGANLEATTNEGLTPLHIACKRDSLEAIKLLLAKGANLEATTNEHLTPLHIACAEGNMALATLLLDKGANPEAATPDGKTPLSMMVAALNARQRRGADYFAFKKEIGEFKQRVTDAIFYKQISEINDPKLGAAIYNKYEKLKHEFDFSQYSSNDVKNFVLAMNNVLRGVLKHSDYLGLVNAKLENRDQRALAMCFSLDNKSDNKLMQQKSLSEGVTGKLKAGITGLAIKAKVKKGTEGSGLLRPK